MLFENTTKRLRRLFFFFSVCLVCKNSGDSQAKTQATGCYSDTQILLLEYLWISNYICDSTLI